MVELLKKIVKKGDKTYTNLFIKLDSGKLIPISVKAIKDSDSKVLNDKDYSIACAVAKVM